MFVICTDSEEKEVNLITTLDNKEEDLLTLEYTKVSSTYSITDIEFCSQDCRTRFPNKNHSLEPFLLILLSISTNNLSDRCGVKVA